MGAMSGIRALMSIVKNYWLDDRTNLFKNYKDALAGAVALIFMPMLSVISLFSLSTISFWNYTFPVLSISVAGLYDSYGRYEGNSPKNAKLVIRVFINSGAIFVSALSLTYKFLSWLAPILLLFSGCILLREIYSRVRKAIYLSPWIS